MKKGKIIYLNGLSGAGKTTLSKTLQGQLEEPYYWVASDMFCSAMAPKRYWDGFAALSLLFHTVKLYSDIGVNSIVDIVHIWEDTPKEKSIFYEGLRILHDCPVLFVNVTCPADELHRRKTERGDPEVDKWLPFQLENFEPKGPYDITVDTLNNTSEECAAQIIELLDNPDNFKAFEGHWLQRKD